MEPLKCVILPGTKEDWPMYAENRCYKIENQYAVAIYLDRNDLSSKMLEEGYIIRNVKGDGSCQFRAVAHELLGNENRHDFIRAEVINYLKKNSYDFHEPIIKCNNGKVYLVNNWDEYLMIMKKPTSWGDNVTLQAVADVFKHQIMVIRSDGKSNTIKPTYLDWIEEMNDDDIINAYHSDNLPEDGLKQSFEEWIEKNNKDKNNSEFNLDLFKKLHRTGEVWNKIVIGFKSECHYVATEIPLILRN
jgi:hypothetical protein